jgi:hypothetical protein
MAGEKKMRGTNKPNNKKRAMRGLTSKHVTDKSARSVKGGIELQSFQWGVGRG